MILITNADFFPKGGAAAVAEFYIRKNQRVCRSMFSTELSALDDGVMHSLVIQGMVSEVLHGPWMADQLQNLMEFGNLPIKLQVTTDKGLHSAIAPDELKSPIQPHLIYLLRTMKDRLTSGTVQKLWWIDTRDMISDVLTKGGLSRKPILELWRNAAHWLHGDAVMGFIMKT